MDTKVEQEVFSYDPTDPEGLDSLHSHIHADYAELELRTIAAGEVPQTDLQRALADPSLSGADRVRLKEIAFLDNYGVSGKELGATLRGAVSGRFDGTQQQSSNVPRS